MRKMSESVRRTNNPLAGMKAAVEALEGRRLLSAAVGTSLAGGVVYRPASDRTPTVAKDSSAARASGKATRAYTNYLQRLPAGVASPTAVGSSAPVGLNAAQVRGAYGLDAVTFGGITGNGAGQTIAIVTAYDHPGFVSSTSSNFMNSDLHKFDIDVNINLPDPPSFTKLDQNGGTNYPAAVGVWAAETALDVEWAHAMAPQANIVLVEANSNSFGDLITAAVNTARNLPGVSVVSMSFGFAGGFAGETFFDPYFTTPNGHAGVTFLAASGDTGSVVPTGGTTGSAYYPAESPNVVAVGGTKLLQTNGVYASETAWSGSGGGISNFQSKPGFQSAVTQSGTFRTTPDVALLADPDTGVAVYDSYNNTSGGGWNAYATGGTSLSAPLYGGLVAVANQGRANIGLPSLNGATQTLQRLYQLPAATLHDITSGSNNLYSAAAGYDLVTGRGSPVGSSTANSLAGGTYTGFVYTDKDGSSSYNAAVDAPLGGMTVYNDLDGDSSLDGNETSATSAANGSFTLDLAAGTTLNIKGFSTSNGYIRTTGSSAGTGTTAYGNFTTGSIGYFPTTYNLPSGQANGLTLRLDAAGTRYQVFQNASTAGSPTYSISKTLISSAAIIVNGGDGDDTLTVDLTSGTPLVSSSFTFNGNGQSSADTINVIAAAGGTAATYAAAGVATGGKTFTLGGVETRQFTGKAGNDTVTISGVTATTSPTFVGGGGADAVLATGAGTVYQPTTDLGGDGTAVSVAVGQQATVVFAANQHLASLDLSGQGAAQLATGRRVLRTSALSINSGQGSYLDVTDGGVILDYSGSSPAATVAALVATGYAAGAWTGLGIRSSTAATTASRAVGYGEASAALNISGAATGLFFDQSVDATTVLLRYTAAGDTNLNGTTNFNDFLTVQSNYGQSGRTYGQGDFDYDGDTDFSDFLTLQSAYGLTA